MGADGVVVRVVDLAQLRTQGLDMGIDGAVAAVQRVGPHPVHQLRARQHRAGALQQRFEQAVFVTGEIERAPLVKVVEARA